MTAAVTAWERWKAGQPARDKDERARFREYAAAAVTLVDPALKPDRGPLQVLSTRRGGNGGPS